MGFASGTGCLTYQARHDGRIESILMSLPRMAGWPYDFKPEKESPEAYTLSKLVKGIDWV